MQGNESEDGDPTLSAPPFERQRHFEIDNLTLVANEGDRPRQIEGIRLAFDRQGIEVSTAEAQSRLLPWTALTTHLVEPWSGEVLPEWWIDPELDRSDRPHGDLVVTDPDSTTRDLPQTESGALLSLQTTAATYRFLAPEADPRWLAEMVAELAYEYQGPSGVPPVTTAVTDRGTGIAGAGDTGSKRARRWRIARPILAVLLLVVLVTGGTVLVLQSAGTIHLPYLGGTNPGVLRLRIQ